MSKTSSYRYVLLVLPLMLVLAGCNSLLARSRYSRPEVTLPLHWQETEVTGTSVVNQHQWWRDYNDPVLSRLIEQALKSNNDLASATIRVKRAQLASKRVNTNITPDVSANVSSSLNRDLNSRRNFETSGASVSASYELDLWGKLASMRDVNRWEAEATEYDRLSTALTLIGTVATNYWTIAYLNERIAFAEASIGYALKTQELVEIKLQLGAVSALEKVQAQQIVANQKAQLSELLQLRAETRTALSILFNQAPNNKMPELQHLPDGEFPQVQPGIPVCMLGQRPDLLAAEQRLRKYLATVDGTRASYYPSFSLTGSLGTSSTSLVEIVKNPYAALGAGLTLPFIQWNTMRLNVEITKADYEEAVINFRQKLYAALRDVENALSARKNYAEEIKYRHGNLELARKAEQLTAVRYQSGAVTLQVWLEAQEQRRDAEKALSVVRLAQLKNSVTLYQVLGGIPNNCSQMKIGVQ